MTGQPVDLDPEAPIADGENAAVHHADAGDVTDVYCDEDTQLPLIHASLTDAQLVTTPRLLTAFGVHGEPLTADANAILEAIAQCRRWDGHASVHQAAQVVA